MDPGVEEGVDPAGGGQGQAVGVPHVRTGTPGPSQAVERPRRPVLHATGASTESCTSSRAEAPAGRPFIVQPSPWPAETVSPAHGQAVTPGRTPCSSSTATSAPQVTTPWE